MALPDPIRERILAHCKTSLQAINGTGSYHTTLVDVERGRTEPDAVDKLPAAYLTEGEELVMATPSGRVTRRLPVYVDAWIRSSAQALPTLANLLLADLERALTSDATRTRGGLAVNTTMTGNGITTDGPPGVLASVHAEFQVYYRTKRGQPEQGG